MRGDEGQALIEFAFVAPLLLIILFAIFDVASALNYWNDETNLANVVARYATIIGSTDTPPSCAFPDGTDYTTIDDTVYEYVKCQAAADSATLSNSVGVCVTDETYKADGGTGTEWAQQDAIKITILYPYKFLNFLSGVIGTSHITLTSSSTMMLEDPVAGSSSGSGTGTPTSVTWLTTGNTDSRNPADTTSSLYNGGCSNVS